MSGTLEVTILGSGSSGGVPRADGNWGDCDPAEPKNLRTRCSLLVRRRGEGAQPPTTLVVDTSPDLRLQFVGAGVKRLDAVLLSHDHADQLHGIDDIRAFFLRQGARIPCHVDEETERRVTQRFDYIFRTIGGYPAICDLVRTPAHGVRWSVQGPSGSIPVVTFLQEHGEIDSVGYRFGDVAYSSDVVGLSDEVLETLQGLDVWIVDALRYRPHPTHANVETALRWIEQVKPKRAILTNLHIDLDYRTLAAELPAGVEPAYDGLCFEHQLRSDFQ